MLDFLKLSSLVEQISPDSLEEIKDRDLLVKKALEVFEQAAADSGLLSKLQENAPWVLWPLAMPLTEESIGYKKAVGPLARETKWTAIGVDGSQIMPSHHEVAGCYLLNAGLVKVPYGLPEPPLLTSIPELYAKPDDLYPLVNRRRVHIDELYVSLERTLFEMELLAKTALASSGPVLAMMDGSIIPWSLEKMPRGYIDEFLGRYAGVFDGLRAAGIPLVGYVSRSRSADLINLLRVELCPYELSHCQEHCGELAEEDFPCSKIWPLTDRVLESRILAIGERSAVFASASPIVKSMAREHSTCFTYLRNESEVARLEFPRYVLDLDFDFVMAATMAQTEKGFGYPLVLAEAHHQAVIRGPERERFFEMLGARMVELGLRQVAVSPKESRKRTSFV